MINKNELRLGNYVQDTVSGGWMIVDEIAETVGAVIVNRENYPLPDGWQMGPIPLTPEILEKCGFVKDEQHECYVIWQSESNVAIEYFDGEVHLVGKSSAEPINNCIYLHQLQNLIYALTGEELQIDLQ